MRIGVIIPLVVFAAFAGLALSGMMFGSGSRDLPSTLVGQPAPVMEPADLADFPGLGESLTEGEVTLVNFWASWCPPCRAEHPQLLRYQAEGLRIVGVNYNDRTGAAAGYLLDDGNPFAAVVFDPDAKRAFDWGVLAPPETFIVSAEGEILHRFIGPLVGSHFEQTFKPALEAALQK